MVGVSTSVNLPLHRKVQKFSSGTGSPGGPGKRAIKRLWCGSGSLYSMNLMFHPTLDTVVIFILGVRYRSMKCNVSFSQGGISMLFR